MNDIIIFHSLWKSVITIVADLAIQPKELQAILNERLATHK